MNAKTVIAASCTGTADERWCESLHFSVTWPHGGAVRCAICGWFRWWANREPVFRHLSEEDE